MGRCSRCGKTTMALCAECMDQVKTGILLNADLVTMILENGSLDDVSRSRLNLLRENLVGFADAFWPKPPKPEGVRRAKDWTGEPAACVGCRKPMPSGAQVVRLPEPGNTSENWTENAGSYLCPEWPLCRSEEEDDEPAEGIS